MIGKIKVINFGSKDLGEQLPLFYDPELQNLPVLVVDDHNSDEPGAVWVLSHKGKHSVFCRYLVNERKV